MSIFMRIPMWIAPLAGVGAVALGLLNWFFHISFIELHMFFGFLVTLALLTAGIVAIFTRGLRTWGVMAIVFASIVPVFGMNQMLILIGDFHWLIQVAHLLVGAVAISLTERICGQYRRIKQRLVPGQEAVKIS